MLNSKVLYGVCDVQIFWTEDETPDGSVFCTLHGVMVGNDNKVELPVETDSDKKHWAEQCEKVSGMSHHWSMREAQIDDIFRLEKYTSESTLETNELGREYLSKLMEEV